MIDERRSFGCASFWLNGEEIIAVSPADTGTGGSSSKAIEFLNLSQENPLWIQGTLSRS